MPAPPLQGSLGRPGLASVKGSDILDGEHPEVGSAGRQMSPQFSGSLATSVSAAPALRATPLTSETSSYSLLTCPLTSQKPPVRTVLPAALPRGPS